MEDENYNEGDNLGIEGMTLPLIPLPIRRKKGRPRKTDPRPIPLPKEPDPLLSIPINWEKYNEYLISVGIGQSSIKQYSAQARKFCRLYYRDIEGDQEELFRKMNMFIQIRRTAIGIERANKRWALYALRHFFDFINRKPLFNEYYVKYGRHIPMLPRKIISKELNPEQILMLYENLEAPWRLIMALQYETGARISEILQIKNENITEQGNTLTLSVRVKGGGMRQLVLFNKTTKDELKALMEVAGNNFIFMRNGAQTKVKDVNKVYRKIGYEFFERPLTSHWLRHSRGVHIYNTSKDILEVKECLGHVDIKTTYAYLKSAGVMVKDVMKKNPVPW